MRRSMRGLALQVQEGLRRDPHGGDLFVFRGRRGDLAKILWHDGIGLSLYAKRLDRGKFIWPSASDGAVSTSPAQMASGFICVMTSRLVELGRPRQYFIIHAIAKANTLKDIWLDMAAFCKPTPMMGMAGSIRPGELLGPLQRPLVGCMHGARSSP
jgi:transposase